MFSKLKEKFVSKPPLYYSMSIAATWAGVGSLLMGMEMAQKYGVVPFLLWAAGNTLACIVFGIFAPRIPKLREIFQSKVMKIVVGLMCPFQVWISLNGIQSIFAETPLSGTYGMVLAYFIAAAFIYALLRYGMIRNVLTDHVGWVAVYAIVLVLAIVAIIRAGGMPRLSLGLENVSVGLEKCLLLIPGAFLYPYYFEILEYNDKNDDGTAKISVTKAFVNGGLLFGLYLAITFLLAGATFGPLLGLVRAFLVTLIAVSSLSSFLYSIYITFGRKIGLVMNIGAVALWQLLVPMGVMGVWTLMSTIRIWIVFAAIVAALCWNFIEKRKERTA